MNGYLLQQSAGLPTLAGRVWRRTGKPLLSGARSMTRVTRNTLMRLASSADHKRWSTTDGLETWWDERTKILAGLVPGGSRVIEFGAGRRQLENYLAKDCSYTPSDLITRGPGTLVCDLNRRPLPSLSSISPQVAVFGGVLEYISDVPSVVKWLAHSGVTTCVVSFDPVPAKLSLVDWYREILRRTYFGYRNNMTEKRLCRSFEMAGYRIAQKSVWTKQVVFQFVRKA